MSDFVLTREEIYQTLKRRKQKPKKIDQLDGKSIEDENIDELIINNKTQKFFKLFEKAFTSEEDVEEEQLDSENGLVQDIFSGIVQKIREKLQLFNKSQLLNFIFKFFIKESNENNIDGKN